MYLKNKLIVVFILDFNDFVYNRAMAGRTTNYLSIETDKRFDKVFYRNLWFLMRGKSI